MNHERLHQVMCLVFYDPTPQLAKDLLDGHLKDWADAWPVVAPRYLNNGFPSDEEGWDSATRSSKELLRGLQQLNALGILDEDQPAGCLMTLVLTIGRATSQAAILMERLNEATMKQERINADH